MLLLDNHDSFTWNLAELLRGIGVVDIKIVSSGDFTADMLNESDRIIFSPGPGLPEEQPAMLTVLHETVLRHKRNEKVPSIFGVCLGMQAIGIYFGAKLINLPNVVHGQPRKLNIVFPGHPIFRGIPDGSPVGLYHSWAVDAKSMPGCLNTLATTANGTIMAIAHQTLPITGVQFHPESIMTPLGSKMIHNWLTA
ncbi:MAG: aminodeoxychorismate/anthranilate synthase component II [Bacteroidota bacterium]